MYDTSSVIKMAADEIGNIEVSDGGNVLNIHWKNSQISRFHAMWLRFTCPCGTCRDNNTNMTMFDMDKIPMDMTITADLEGDCVLVKWIPENHCGLFNIPFLQKNCMSDASLDANRKLLKPDMTPKNTVTEIQYSEIMNSKNGMYRWLKTINEDGLCMLKGVPTEDKYSKKIYTVLVESKPINMAYTNSALPLHMDLMQYEAPPGIQFLHCLEFDENTEGGETTFQDVFSVAEKFREVYPEHFEILCKIPVTFERVHKSRDDPVIMRTRKPIFSVNDYGEIVGINWHSNLTGPLITREKDVGLFYKAYQTFGKMLSDKTTMKEVRFQPGDLIAYNNRRMTHGRNGFISYGDGKRILQGGYINIDEYRSKLLVLAEEIGDFGPIKRIFNNDWT